MFYRVRKMLGRVVSEPISYWGESFRSAMIFDQSTNWKFFLPVKQISNELATRRLIIFHKILRALLVNSMVGCVMIKNRNIVIWGYIARSVSWPEQDAFGYYPFHKSNVNGFREGMKWKYAFMQLFEKLFTPSTCQCYLSMEDNIRDIKASKNRQVMLKPVNALIARVPVLLSHFDLVSAVDVRPLETDYPQSSQFLDW